MKEATGELNMTVITLIAIAAIGALFYAFVWPMIQRSIAEQTCQTYGTAYHAKEAEKNTCEKDCVASSSSVDENTNEKVVKWCCCKTAKAANNDTTTP